MKQEQEEKQEQEQEQEKKQEKASRDRDINMIMDGYKDIGKQMLARHPKTKNPDQFFDLMLQQFPFLGVDKFFCSVFPSIAGIILAERDLENLNKQTTTDTTNTTTNTAEYQGIEEVW
jgi:hypothetical protein